MIDQDRIAGLNEVWAAPLQEDLEHLAGRLDRRNGASADDLVSALAEFDVAAPSWAVGTGGTRFGRFPIGGEPRTTEEKIDDVALLNRLTASNGTISLHVPWDDPDDPDGLREYAEERSIGFDAMNSNTFQDNPSTTDDGKLTYKFGSLANADPAVREVAVEHNKYVIDLGVRLGSTALTVWLADGINHPGQADHTTQFETGGGGAPCRSTTICPTAGRCTPSTSHTSRPSMPRSTPTGARRSSWPRRQGRRLRAWSTSATISPTPTSSRS